MPTINSRSSRSRTIKARIHHRSTRGDLLTIHDRRHRSVTYRRSQIRRIQVTHNHGVRLTRIARRPRQPQIILIYNHSRLKISIRTRSNISSHIRFHTSTSKSATYVRGTQSKDGRHVSRTHFPNRIHTLHHRITRTLSMPLKIAKFNINSPTE